MRAQLVRGVIRTVAVQASVGVHALDQHAVAPADERRAARVPEPVGERAQPLGAAALDRRRHGIGVRGARARARRVREDVQAREPELLHGRERALEGGAVLGREADDDVAGEVQPGHGARARARCGATYVARS